VLVEPEAIFYNYGSFICVTDTWQNEYSDGIVDNVLRNTTVKQIAEKYLTEGKQVMILTKMIRHGDWFKSNVTGSDLIYGRTEDDLRVEILEDFKQGKLKCLVGNLKIFNKGINIPNLDVIINASGNAGDVVTVQTIGRCLRKSPGKEKATYIDFMDAGDYLNKHSVSRIAALKAEDYRVKIEKYINI
jgi:superfamily II DNA or RNA helicase